MTIPEAAQKGIKYLRQSQWADKFDHVAIDIVDGKVGPWLHCYFPLNKSLNGRDPVDIVLQDNWAEQEYEEYTGPLFDSSEYKQAVLRFTEEAFFE